MTNTDVVLFNPICCDLFDSAVNTDSMFFMNNVITDIDICKTSDLFSLFFFSFFRRFFLLFL